MPRPAVFSRHSPLVAPGTEQAGVQIPAPAGQPVMKSEEHSEPSGQGTLSSKQRTSAVVQAGGRQAG